MIRKDEIFHVCLFVGALFVCLLILMTTISIPISSIQYVDAKNLCDNAPQHISTRLEGSFFNKKCFIYIDGLPYDYSKLHHMQLKQSR